MNYELKFFSVATTAQDISEFNPIVLGSDIIINRMELIVYNGSTYAVGYAFTKTPLTRAIAENTYRSNFLLPELKKNLISNIKSRQKELYMEIEGDGDVNFKRAESKAYSEANFDDYDRLMFQKKHVRDAGNKLESNVLAISNYDDLLNFKFTINYPLNPTPRFIAITVGSFISRFTADEKELIEIYMETDKNLKKEYEAMLNRTHINLKDKTLEGFLFLLAQENILGPVSDTTNNSSRVEELLRLGDELDAWRPRMS